MPKNFSIKEALKFGWETTLEHIGFFVVALLVAWALTLIPQLFAGGPNNPLKGLVTIIAFLINVGIALGFIRVSLKLVNREEPAAQDFYPDWKQYWPYVGASIIVGAIVMAGFILLIVPGIVFALALMFYGYLLVDKGLRPIAAIKGSRELTEGIRWHLLQLLLVEVGIGILGAIALGVGLFLAIPTIMLANAYIYRKLSGQETLPGI